MTRSSHTRGILWGSAGCWGALFSLAVAGCGATESSGGALESVGTTSAAVTTNWEYLTLNPGWQKFGTGFEPAVRKVDDIIVFKGALKATNPTSDSPFTLPSTYRASPNSNIHMPIVLSKPSGQSGKYGDLSISLDGVVHVTQNGYQGTAAEPVGPQAKVFTSLEGASFDQVAGTLLDVVDGWRESYGTRVPPGSILTPPALVKSVGGSHPFVRFQGGITWAGSGSGGPLFTIPDSSQLGFDAVPDFAISLPTHLGGSGVEGSWGLIKISPVRCPYNTYLWCADAFVDGNFNASNSLTSFEGVSFSKATATQAGTFEALPLATGWSAYSPRPVRVGIFQNVVRFQGAVKGGSGATTTVATLPDAYRPPRKVYVVAGAYTTPLPARLVIHTDGKVEVDDPGLSYAKAFLTLDSVSFAR